ncbi:MAG: hypothetical protein IID41_00515 [Planctomycetes bacterium]|nr:hypothetical protein [Planctomycetota bacterium]
MSDHAEAINFAKILLARGYRDDEDQLRWCLARAVIVMANDLEAYRIIDEVLEVANRCESCGGQPAECEC